MESLKHKNKELEFWSQTGVVLDTNKYSETHVSMSGGGGSTGPHGGYINPPTLHSSAITKHEFWIRSQDGSESAVNLTGVDIPLRPGQKITLINTRLKNKSGLYSILVNHTAKQHWYINNANAINKNYGIEGATGISLIYAIAGYALTLFLADALVTPGRNNEKYFTLAFGVSVAVIIYRIIRKIIRTNIFTRKLGKHLEKLAQQTYETEKQS